jgi:3-hydroxyisobutyrate dehydrogenase
MPQSTLKLGFVGLGNMGTPMCSRLLARGYPVDAFDIDSSRVAALAEAGAHPAASLATLGASSDIVLLSLPNSDIIEEIVLSPGGLGDAMRPGSALIDLSSARPASTRHIAAALAARNITMLDAPVSGGVPRARDGTLTVMAGGDQATFERCRPILEALSSALFYVGPSGAGDLTKALNNLLSATTLASAAEVVLMAERAGLDPAQFVAVINASTGRSNSTEVKFPRYILPRTFADGFALGLMDKDVQIALGAATELGIHLPIGTVVAWLWHAAAQADLEAAGHTRIYEYLEAQLTEDPPATES